MNLKKAAIRNHKELFPNYKSTLQETDLELIEVFDCPVSESSQALHAGSIHLSEDLSDPIVGWLKSSVISWGQ